MTEIEPIEIVEGKREAAVVLFANRYSLPFEAIFEVEFAQNEPYQIVKAVGGGELAFRLYNAGEPVAVRESFNNQGEKQMIACWPAEMAGKEEWKVVPSSS